MRHRLCAVASRRKGLAEEAQFSAENIELDIRRRTATAERRQRDSDEERRNAAAEPRKQASQHTDSETTGACSAAN